MSRVVRTVVVIAALLLVIGLYFLALNLDTNKNFLKPGDYAEYAFSVEPLNISGTYRWVLLSIDDKKTDVLERTNTTTYGLQNYTSYLDLRTGEITRHRVTANSTLTETLCFVLADESRAASCKYYAPLKVSDGQFSFGNVQRAAWKAELDAPAYNNSYILFDKKTGIILYSITDLNGASSEYSLIGTNIF